jgi:hypothetical protein
MKHGSRGLALAFLLAAIAAGAEAPGRDPAAADHLFNEGRQLMRAKRYAEACQAFERSQRLDPGLGTLLNLGDCYEELGRFASAWRVFKQAADQAAQASDTKRSVEARMRVSALEPRLSRLRIQAPAGVELSCDGDDLKRTAEGADIAVDPGAHDIRASQTGRSDWSVRVEVAAGSGVRWVHVPPLGLPGQSLLPKDPTDPPPGGEVVRSGGKPVALGTTLTVAGAVVAAVGVAGIIYAFNVSGALERQQPGGPDFGHPTVSKSQYDQLSWLYPSALVATGVGGASLAGGVYVFAYSPGGSGGGGTVGVGGTF